MTKLKRFFDFLVRCFYFLHRRDKKLIVYCGARDLFVDNCKYQFLYNVQHMPSFQHVWLTKNVKVFDHIVELGLNVMYADSYEGRRCLKKAGYCIFDDGLGVVGSPNLLTGAVRINLWHGVPAKFITYDKSEPREVLKKKVSLIETIRYGHIRGDYGFSTSRKLNYIFTHFFSLPENRILIGAYPRTFPFFLNDSELKDFLLKYENPSLFELFCDLKKCEKKKIIYMPTFRDGNKSYMNEAIPNWNALNQSCQNANIVFFVKVHRAAEMPDVSDFSNVKVIDKNVDVYPILSQFELLVTDYSSIMFDYSLTGHKVLLYPYDMEEYAAKSRNIYSYFWSLIKKLTCVNSFEALLVALSMNLEHVNAFPIDDFFDCPQDFNVVKNFIQSR